MGSSIVDTDEQAAEMIRTHHATLVGRLGELVEALRQATEADFENARAELSEWLRSELVPHAVGEETTFYRAAAGIDRGKLLVDALISEHRVIRDMAQQIDMGRDRAELAGWAQALLRAFVSHAALENDLVLPLLVEDPDTDLSALLHQMHSH